MKFKGRVAVITGAAAGMGREFALQLCKAGADLALCDVDLNGLETVRAECRKTRSSCVVEIATVDVSAREQVSEFAKQISSTFGRAHILINNAGVAAGGAFDRQSIADFDWCFNINFHGVVNCTRAFLPMLKATDKDGGACIVNMSSVAGFWPQLGLGLPYISSKYAVRGFSEGLLVEARAYYPHVNVVTVHPGLIITDIVDNSRADDDDRAEASMPKSLRPSAGDPNWAEKTEQERIQAMKDQVNDLYSKFGYSAKETVASILASVARGDTRVRVGWDSVIIDWWMRAFPRIFIAPTKLLVPLTAFVLRRAYLPLAVGAVGVGVVRALRSNL